MKCTVMNGANEYLILGEWACKMKIFLQFKCLLMDCLIHLFFLVHERVPFGTFYQILYVSLQYSLECMYFNRNYIMEIIIKSKVVERIS